MPPRPLSTSPRPTLPVRLLRRKVSSHSSRVPVLTSSVVSPVLVCFPSTIKSSSSCSAKPSRVDPVKLLSLHIKTDELQGVGIFIFQGCKLGAMFDAVVEGWWMRRCSRGLF